MKRLLSLLMAALMLLTAFPLCSFAANGPSQGEQAYSYIYIVESDKNNKVFVFGDKKTVGTVAGFSYDKPTNTLTVSNYKNETTHIYTNEMGDDFKIKVVGNCSLNEIYTYGFGYGGSLNITGNGSLTVNAAKTNDCAIHIEAEHSAAKFIVDSSVSLKLYPGSDGASVYIADTSVATNAVVFNKAPKESYKVTSKSYPSYKYIETARLGWTWAEYIYKKSGDDNSYFIKKEEVWYSESEHEDRYSVFVLSHNEKYGDIALPVAGEQNLKAIPAAYTITENSMDITTPGTTSFAQYQKANDDSIYIGIVYTDYQSGEISEVDMYKVDMIDGFGYMAVPIESEQDLTAIPSGYSRTVEAYYYTHTINTALSMEGSSHQHTYKTTVTKATLSKNGSIITKCSGCGAVQSSSVIYYPKTISLTTSSYTYDGKEKKPGVKVVDSRGKAISSANYTLSYSSGRKSVGRYAVKVTFKGNYSGSKTLYYNINPKGTALSSVSGASKSVNAKWKKQTSQTTGYQLQFSLYSNFSKPITKTVTKNGTTSLKATKLYSGKRYYVRIRTYKSVGKTNFYSSWSSAKNTKTK